MNILFCGTGGQGILKMAEICAVACMFDGFHVKKSEVHGMAQRGGSVESHLRFGKEIFSPLIPYGQADFLVSMHADEEARLAGFLKKEGVNLSRYLEEVNKLKDRKYANTFLLGVLSAHLKIKEENWIKSIEQEFAGRAPEENKKIFKEGRKRGQDDLE
ncbi:MAG: indolepyruvate oxidoreductase subunit beta [Candidatus Omnitrophica bacterium]|jgi:indolepyruvate ferredoxin oxidoreductase beta subunit|nr:indolepyruvate oxidoreductase subunit beta [Candidatus Omnitrophota bacterium]